MVLSSSLGSGSMPSSVSHDTDSRSRISPPHHIQLPPPPLFLPSSLTPSPSNARKDPFDSPSIYYTAPSSPYVDSPTPYTVPLKSPPSPPPQPPIHRSLPPDTSSANDPAQEMPIDPLALDDGTLGPLERIYLYSRSKAPFHRVFIIHALSSFLEQITPLEADEYVLPLLRTLALDEDETVQEALATELTHIIWWFFTHCQLVSEDTKALEYHQPTPAQLTTICVTAFTPILGTLLLSPNSSVGSPARQAVVDILLRIRCADEKEGLVPPVPPAPQYGMPLDDDDPNLLSDDDLPIGLFHRGEREMLARELLWQVVIAIGKLDVKDLDDTLISGGDVAGFDYDEWPAVTPLAGTGQPGIAWVSSGSGAEPCVEPIDDEHKSENNPYFPSLAAPSPVESSSSESTPSSTASTTSSSPSSAAETIDMHDVISDASGSTASPPDNRQADSPPEAAGQHESEGPLEHYLPNMAAEPQTLPISNYSSPPFMSDPHSNLSPSDPARSSPEEPSRPTDTSASQQPGHSGLLSSDIIGRSQSPPPSDSTYSVSSNFHTNTDVRRYPETEGMDVDTFDELDSDTEQAAVGRVSSMSLMAAVAASGALSGSLGEETKHAFVKEVERVGRDPVHWVRREASFALGALAKVVPQEVVVMSLLPLYECLQHDPVWHVRHSALFALPAVLSRLSPPRRRALALNTLLPLVRDASPAVRSGVLEALGEVIYTFHEDEEGPPNELLHLFLGRREDKRVRDGSQQLEEEMAFWRIGSPMHWQSSAALSPEDPTEAFFTDPIRPLTCAFNYPAVAATLGRRRWDDLREAYLELAENRAAKVRRTLAASLGALAKNIGAEHAERDLLGVWWDAIKCEDEDVRGRAVECTAEFMQELGKVMRVKVLIGLLDGWNSGSFKDWRERRTIAKMLGVIAGLVQESGVHPLRGLLMKALEDNVAAIREAAVSSIPVIYRTFSDAAGVLRDLHNDVTSLSRSTAFRKRMTFIACKQALIAPGTDSPAVETADDEFWRSLAHLADDSIVGVRIGIARLVGFYYGEFCRGAQPSPSRTFSSVAKKLALDASPEVQAFVPSPALLEPSHGDEETAFVNLESTARRQLGRIFSQPPLMPRTESAATMSISDPPAASFAASEAAHSAEARPSWHRPEPESLMAIDEGPASRAHGESAQIDELGTALFARLERIGESLLRGSPSVGAGLHSSDRGVQHTEMMGT